MPKLCVWLLTLLDTSLFSLDRRCAGLDHFFSKIFLTLLINSIALCRLPFLRSQIYLHTSALLLLILIICVAFLLQALVNRHCHLFRNRIFANSRVDIFDSDFWGWSWQTCRLRVSRTNQRFISIVCYERQTGHLRFCIQLYKVCRDWVIGRRFVVF